MPEAQVIVVMRRFKQALLAKEQNQMYAMSQRWIALERALDGQIAALSHEFTRLHLTGGSVSMGALSRMGRYRALLAQLTRELSNYTDYAEDVITRQQEANAKLAIQHSEAAIDASVTTRIGVNFNRLPIEAVQHMVGLAGDGSPLRDLLTDTWPDAAQGLTQELINGIALGRNPRETAERMVNGTTRALNRMLNIARTEQLRVWRETARQSYITSGVVRGYYRLATHDGRACISCLLDEGKFYRLDQVMPTHPSCRCSPVPAVKGVDAPEWEKGEQWFRAQPETTQESILGRGKFAAWRAGKFDLDSIVKVVRNDVWGDSIQPKTLGELVGA